MQDGSLKYKNEFAIKFASLMQTKCQEWKMFQKKAQLRLLNWSSLVYYVGITAIGFVPGKHETEYNLNLHIFVAICCFIFAVITNIANKNKEYQKSVKATLFPELLKTFHQNIYYAKEEDENIYKISSRAFEYCGLYNEPITERTDDDIFHGDYKDIKFKMNETDFGRMVTTSRGGQSYHRLFKGLAMHFKMNKEIKTTVLIMPKTFFMQTPKMYEEVQLEDVEFNKRYKVFVRRDYAGNSGQIEARYLLNTLFINRFLQLKASFKIDKIACSVVNDEMLVMLSTRKNLFEMNHLFGKIDDPSQYQHLFDEFASVFSFIDVLNVTSKTKL
jgi:hypothetical protein